jgi:hypothetical protein
MGVCPVRFLWRKRAGPSSEVISRSHSAQSFRCTCACACVCVCVCVGLVCECLCADVNEILKWRTWCVGGCKWGGYDGSCGKGGRGAFTRGRVGTAEDMDAAVLGARREQMIYWPCVRASVKPSRVNLTAHLYRCQKRPAVRHSHSHSLPSPRSPVDRRTLIVHLAACVHPCSCA